MLKMTHHGVRYRGYDLGYHEGLHGFIAIWSRPGERREGCIYVDTKEETIPLAKECINFYFRVQVQEMILDRPLTTTELMNVEP